MTSCWVNWMLAEWNRKAAQLSPVMEPRRGGSTNAVYAHQPPAYQRFSTAHWSGLPLLTGHPLLPIVWIMATSLENPVKRLLYECLMVDFFSMFHCVITMDIQGSPHTLTRYWTLWRLGLVKKLHMDWPEVHECSGCGIHGRKEFFDPKQAYDTRTMGRKISRRWLFRPDCMIHHNVAGKPVKRLLNEWLLLGFFFCVHCVIIKRIQGSPHALIQYWTS